MCSQSANPHNGRSGLPKRLAYSGWAHLQNSFFLNLAFCSVNRSSSSRFAELMSKKDEAIYVACIFSTPYHKTDRQKEHVQIYSRVVFWQKGLFLVFFFFVSENKMMTVVQLSSKSTTIFQRICVHLCACVVVWRKERVRLEVCVFQLIYVCIYLHGCAYAYMYINTYMYINLVPCAYIHVCERTYIYMGR